MASPSSVRKERNTLLVTSARCKPCTDCGRSYPAEVMDLDHSLGIKAFNLTGMFALNRPTEEVAAKLAKCEVRCPTCHRLRHFVQNRLLNLAAQVEWVHDRATANEWLLSQGWVRLSENALVPARPQTQPAPVASTEAESASERVPQ